MAKKTAIHIIPNLEDGKGDYLIIFMDENAYADFLAGKDKNPPVTAFGVHPMDKKKVIDSILIELYDGVPKVVTATEE